MADYHVSFDKNGIYAGTINKAGTKWSKASVVTDEAMSAVASYMKTWLDHDGHDKAIVNCDFSDGTHGNLILELTDENYEWHDNGDEEPASATVSVENADNIGSGVETDAEE